MWTRWALPRWALPARIRIRRSGSTVDDLRAFGEMLPGGGNPKSTRVLARPAVALMTTNRLAAERCQPWRAAGNCFDTDGVDVGTSV
jgi:hypothetical protein